MSVVVEHCNNVKLTCDVVKDDNPLVTDEITMKADIGGGYPFQTSFSCALDALGLNDKDEQWIYGFIQGHVSQFTKDNNNLHFKDACEALAVWLCFVFRANEQEEEAPF